jgi:hypothetical protein
MSLNKNPHPSGIKKWGSKSPHQTFPPGKDIGEQISEWILPELRRMSIWVFL